MDLTGLVEGKKVDWILYPFPHAIIDDFLPEFLFKEISSIDQSSIGDLRRKNTTGLEFNKKEYGIKNKSSLFRIPIDLMGFQDGKNLFSKFINPEKIITLASNEDFGGFFPYHVSSRNGLLGSHIDHSCLGDNFHFANSIFYVHKRWEREWGGETILFNNNGFKPIVYIEPKPNRMVLFIHSSKSFHGVKKILCPKEITRNTYYMDYYLNPKDINLLNNNIEKRFKGIKKLKFSFHQTTFIPFFPMGISNPPNFNINVFPYLVAYLIYLIFKLLPIEMSFTKKLFQLIIKIKGIIATMNRQRKFFFK